MWRKSHHSWQNITYDLNTMQNRRETLDKDLIVLQKVATLMDANEFLIHVLNRYKLIDFFKEDFDWNNLNVSFVGIFFSFAGLQP